MKRLISLELDEDEGCITACPYLKFKTGSYSAIDEVYYCDHPSFVASPTYNIIISEAKLMSLDSWPPIPEWCPLQRWKEGDKF